jgi:rare lipoprotein A
MAMIIQEQIGRGREIVAHVLLWSILLVVIVLLNMFVFYSDAHAKGWSWFLTHIHPRHACGFGEHEIIGSFYGTGYRTANGEHYRPWGISAAHRTLPFHSTVTIRNPRNERTLAVRINDRGPYIHGVSADGAIDLSLGAAKQLGMTQSEWICVRY